MEDSESSTIQLTHVSVVWPDGTLALDADVAVTRRWTMGGGALRDEPAG